ncbi:fap1 adhesin-like [Physella acuta]|uniref:fap1 adhesin-like n=1 Tax=Physella acuta TaxID=109671 RepID=UPI0027DBAF49|nr:fap1 adhesin-like [Physella acuta]
MSGTEHSAVPYTRLVNLEVHTRAAFHSQESRKFSAGSNNNKRKTHFSGSEKKVSPERGRLMRHKSMALKKASTKEKLRIQYSYTVLHSDSDDSGQSTSLGPEVDRSTKLVDACNSRKTYTTSCLSPVLEEGEVSSPSEPEKSLEFKKPPLELKEPITRSKKPHLELKESITESKKPHLELKESITESKKPHLELKESITESKKPPLELKGSITKSKKPPLELKESITESKKQSSEFNAFLKESKSSPQKSTDCLALVNDSPPRISPSPSSSQEDATPEGSQDFTVQAENSDPSLQDSDGSVLSMSRTLIPEERTDSVKQERTFLAEDRTDSVKQDTQSFRVSSDYVKQLCAQPPLAETSVSTSFDEIFIHPVNAPKSQESITDAMTSSWGLTEQENRPKKFASRVRVMLKPEDIEFFDKYIKPLRACCLSASYTDWLKGTTETKHPFLTANDLYIDVSEIEKFETDTRRFLSRHVSNIPEEEEESVRIDTLKDLTLISKDASDSDLSSLSDSDKTNERLDFNGASPLESSAPSMSYKPGFHELNSLKNVTLISKELSDSDQDSLSGSVKTQGTVKFNETTSAEGSHMPVIKTSPNKFQFSQMKSLKDSVLSSKELSDTDSSESIQQRGILKFQETTYAEASEQAVASSNPNILFKTNFNKLRSRLSRDRAIPEENSEREIDCSCNRLDEMSLSQDEWIVATPPLYGWEDTYDEESPVVERSREDLWRSVLTHAKKSANTAAKCIGTVGDAFGWWSVVQHMHSYLKCIEDKDNLVPTDEDDGYGFLEIDNDNDDKA